MINAYTGMAVTVDGVLFLHPCDGGEGAASAHQFAVGRPYLHLYAGDTIGEIIQWMEDTKQEMEADHAS